MKRIVGSATWRLPFLKNDSTIKSYTRRFSPNTGRFDKKKRIGRLSEGLRHPPARKEQPMDLSEPVKRILSYYESDTPGTKANLARILLQDQARRHRQAADPAGGSGCRARPGPQLCAEPAGLRPALPLPAGDRGGAQRLCRAAGL